jgi:GNAT superfamily N-acetyltransferase
MTVPLVEGYVPGCIGRIAELHAGYYGREHGFGVAFEAKVARELAEFCVHYRQGRDGLWLAMDGDRVQGSVAIDGSQAATRGAHLRWFITSDAVRGKGAGSALLRAALSFADSRGYKRIHLWTFAGLDAARHLYEKHGFTLVQESPGQQWGKVVDEQCFVRGSA